MKNFCFESRPLRHQIDSLRGGTPKPDSRRFPGKYRNDHKILVTGNGTGVDQAHSQKIFELFQRLHQSGKYTGTGLDLAICKKIANITKALFPLAAKNVKVRLLLITFRRNQLLPDSVNTAARLLRSRITLLTSKLPLLYYQFCRWDIKNSCF